MDHVWTKVESLRDEYEVLREDRTPIDVFTFLEVDLGLDPISFDDLVAKYRGEAAITADFTGIYLDAEQYLLMERGPEWKLNRLRFTVAHELAHYFLHRHLPQPENFASLPDFARWTDNYGGRKYTIEQEANEFSGRLLVPKKRLQACYDEFAPQAALLWPCATSSRSPTTTRRVRSPTPKPASLSATSATPRPIPTGSSLRSSASTGSRQPLATGSSGS